MKDLDALARQYIKERVDKGELNRRSAACLRCKLLDFAAHANGKFTAGKVNRWLARPGLSASYRRDRYYALRNFSRWCLKRGHVAKDPFADLAPPKVPKGLPRSLSTEDAQTLYAHTMDLREKLIVLLMLQEALRRVEVSRIQLADVDFRTRRLQVRGKGGDGGPTRVVWLTDETLTAMRSFINEHQISSGPVVRSYKYPERGIAPPHVSHIVLQIFRRAGLKYHANDGRSAHALRHTSLTDMVKGGADIRQVQKVAGHASLRTTQIYTEGAGVDLEAAMAGRSYTRAS